MNNYFPISKEVRALETGLGNLGVFTLHYDVASTAIARGDRFYFTDNNLNFNLTGMSVFGSYVLDNTSYFSPVAVNNSVTMGVDNLILERNTETTFLLKYNGTTLYTGTIPTVTNSYTTKMSGIGLCLLVFNDSKSVIFFTSVPTYTSQSITVNPASNSGLGFAFSSEDFAYLDSSGIAYTTYGTISSQLNTDINTLYDKSVPFIEDADPYAPVGNSDTGGGGGTFDGSSDPVPVPALPSVGATNTGFISLFVPSQAQLKQVADYLWGGFFDLSTYLKIFENPMDCILGLSVVPVSVPTSGNAQITVGNVELSGITLPLASQQYVEVDCGSIPFTDKFFGSYLDQDPYTKMSLFVPYSGVHSVKADDIMGKTVNLKYHVDILTGSVVAFLTCGDSVLYEFNGACASNIPVNSMNYASTIENAIRIGVNIGTTVATAGASAPLTGANKAARESARTFGTAVNMAGSTAEGILSLKPNIDRAGSLGGTTGLMGNQIPYFIITRPRLCKPANQNTFKGYPSFIQVTISDLIGEGYTEFDTVVLAGLYLTDGEKEELKQILESGVYL